MVRQQITYVSQHPHIMKGTLREVLSFGMDVSDKEILDACKEVQLLDVISRHADGLDAVIGEGGLGLSGGERQRVALARAFLRKGQVLILDEVTAHLDVKTEAIISSAIKRLMDNKNRHYHWSSSTNDALGIYTIRFETWTYYSTRFLCEASRSRWLF